MSTYRPKGRKHYLYDFQVGGARFHGTTGCARKREADLYEDERREEARAQIKAARALGRQPMTFGIATTRYWDEVGQFAKSQDDIERMLAWLQREVGKTKRLTAITGSVVAALVAKRRGEPGRKGQPLSPAAVNRPIELLRSVVFRAQRLWDEPVAAVDWRKHRLKEPQERVRELRAEEEVALFAALRPDYHAIVRFALVSGCRLAECVGLRWSDIDWGGRQIWIRGKGSTLAAIPLSPTLRALLWPLQGRHPEAVFTFSVERARGKRRRGDLEPITYEGLKTVFARQVRSVVPGYRFHDNRHTAATRILRASGNLKVAQVLLRHTSIATTTKYAHVMQDDVMAAMEKAAAMGVVDLPQKKARDAEG